MLPVANRAACNADHVLFRDQVKHFFEQELHPKLEQWEVADKALQLHGGSGYMNECMSARLWRYARFTRIFGGTSEIMKEVVARSL